MTLSSTKSYSPVRDDVLKRALRLVGAYASSANPQANQIADANSALNMMLKAWQVQNFLWVKQYVTLFTVPGQAAYSLPGAHGATKYLTDALAANCMASETVIEIADTTNVNTGFIIGVYLTSGALHWDTVASVDSSTQLTLTTGLAEAASSGAVVYLYAAINALYRPTRIFSAVRVQSGGNEISLAPMGRDDYSALPNKSTQSLPVQFYFDPQTSVAKLYLWPTPQTAADRIVLDVDRPLTAMVDSANTFDFPDEWIEVISYGLAVRLAPEYAVPVNERALLTQEFTNLASNLLAYNIDHSSVFFGVEEA
jgi:hypothetical protein